MHQFLTLREGRWIKEETTTRVNWLWLVDGSALGYNFDVSIERDGYEIENDRVRILERLPIVSNNTSIEEVQCFLAILIYQMLYCFRSFLGRDVGIGGCTFSFLPRRRVAFCLHLPLKRWNHEKYRQITKTLHRWSTLVFKLRISEN